MLKNVLIGTNVAYTSATAPHLLASGEIGVYSQAVDGTLTLVTLAIDAAQGKLPIVIAQGAPAGTNFKQFVIQPGQKTAYLNTAYVAPIPNVYNIGFDGTALDLVSGAAGVYSYSIKNTTLGNPPFPSLNTTPFFAVANQATSGAIALSAVKDLNAQTLLAAVDIMPQNRFAISEILSNATSVQLVTSAPANITGTFTNGSTNVTLSGSTAGGTTAAVVGDFIRVGNATAKTASVYKIASISGTAVVLDNPYMNSELAIGVSIATVALGYITAAAYAAATAGIRVVETGNIFNGSSVLEPQTNKILSVACNINASGTPVQNNGVVARAYMTAAGTPATGTNPALSGQLLPYTEGAGTYPQVFKKELTAAGYAGFINRTFLPDNFPLYSISGTNYVTLGLQYNAPAKDFTGQGFQFGQSLSAIIAIPTGASQITTLNTILASANW
jgi:hypothetical protein